LGSVPVALSMRTRLMRIGLGASALALLVVIGAGISWIFPPPKEFRRVAPETSFPPAIKGAPIVGKTLQAGKGLWKHTPTKFAYQWMRCDAKGEDCLKIAGETTGTHVLTTADLAHTIVVLVTASNSEGSETANSHPTNVVLEH
jgi:hypothetical protein